MKMAGRKPMLATRLSWGVPLPRKAAAETSEAVADRGSHGAAGYSTV
jgi:hypothetical protein